MLTVFTDISSEKTVAVSLTPRKYSKEKTSFADRMKNESCCAVRPQDGQRIYTYGISYAGKWQRRFRERPLRIGDTTGLMSFS